ncbi:MAG: pirin family protein [Ferrimicrobium sp.]
MPAVTVSSQIALPVVPTLDRQLLERELVSLTVAPHGVEGEGFPVRRAFAGVSSERLDPFVHMDEMGSVEYAPGEPKGTPWHPHRGFETVTYMIDGEFVHRDSQGGGGHLRSGDTQWMTAGAGILHIETPPEELVVSGGLFHGFQLWVNLPRARKWANPSYQEISGSKVAYGRSADGGAFLRVIAGRLGDIKGPGSTYTPINLVHTTLAPGAQLAMEWPASFNALVYVISGVASLTSKRVGAREGHLAVLDHGEWISVANPSSNAELDLLLLGGEPIGEPVACYGPFVMNTRDELQQAVEDYHSGRMGVIPATTPGG